MTYRKRGPWIDRNAFRSKPLPERVRYVRSNLKGSADDEGMTQPELAKALGIRGDDHHTIVRWEKGHSEPKRYRRKLAGLTPYEPEDFSLLGEVEALRARLATAQGRAAHFERLLAEHEERSARDFEDELPEAQPGL